MRSSCFSKPVACLQDVPGFAQGLPKVCPGFPRVCPGFAQGFPRVFPGFARSVGPLRMGLLCSTSRSESDAGIELFSCNSMYAAHKHEVEAGSSGLKLKVLPTKLSRLPKLRVYSFCKW